MCACVAKKPLYYPAVRWMRDDDRRAIEMPPVNQREAQILAVDSATYRQLEGLMGTSGAIGAEMVNVASGSKQEALDVNNFDEVADSTWFENRMGRRRLSRSDILREASVGGSPSPEGAILVMAGKTQGKVQRLFVMDGRGREYLLRFEPPGLRGIANGAEIVSSMILNAAGYHVPRDHLFDLDTGRLTLAKDARTRGKYGDIVPMTRHDLDVIVDKVTGGRGGRIRAVASRIDVAEYMGPFSFEGRRYKDTNDRVPHQHRRELRAYKVFCSWLNMTSPSSARTADMFVRTEGEKGYVMHYIFDFGSAFGGAGSWERLPDSDQFREVGAATRAADVFTLGLHEDDGSYEDDEYGFLNAGSFKPGSWSPSVPNEAFAYMNRSDGFWAARIIMRFADEDIDAIVDKAGFEDEGVRRYVARSLKRRRDKIGRYWFSQVNPLSEFRISKGERGTSIDFEDLAVEYGFAHTEGTEYRHRLVTRFDRDKLTPWTRTSQTRVELDAETLSLMNRDRVYVVKVQTKRPGDEWWSPSVYAYLERYGDGVRLLGLRRRYGLH